MYSTEIGAWKTITNKNTGNHHVPMDSIAKWSARNQFKAWLQSIAGKSVVERYMSAATKVRYSYEQEVAELTVDLVEHSDTLMHDKLCNRSLRDQLEQRGINHHSLSQWRIVSAVLIAEMVSGVILTKEKLRKTPPTIH